jgi:hypothetical protein
VNASGQCHGISTGSDHLQPFAEDGLGQHRCCGGAVASDVIGLAGCFFDELGPQILVRSSRSMSSATVTPSLVTLGEPQPLSSTALRPRGPSVLLTARASLETPASNGWRASSSNTICFATRSSFKRRVERTSRSPPGWFWQPARSMRQGMQPSCRKLIHSAKNFCWQKNISAGKTSNFCGKAQFLCRRRGPSLPTRPCAVLAGGGPTGLRCSQPGDSLTRATSRSRPQARGRRLPSRSAVWSASASEIVSTAECM